MKKILKRLSTSLIIALLLLGCKEESVQSSIEKVPPAQQPPINIEGTVISTMDAGGYTYVEVDKQGNKIWIAGPATKVTVGEKVSAPGGMPMTNFNSKSLGRTFDEIFFVGAIITSGSGAPASGPHANMPQRADSANRAPAIGKISKAKGGYTVEELFAKKDSLKGKEVSVRGKVVKANFGIMGKNWFHIQDGSGKAGTNDIIVTSSQKAKVGDVILAKAYLETDKDLGSGYKYDVILEDAAITVESK
ncbi:MAG: DNA-binding protein [Proteobacteria bacterium]|nr:DNA-binding protein [Pseudomonadota bacterium]